MYQAHNKQSGFTILEVLITMVITSIALLSSVGLQVFSKRSNYDAAQRTTAAHLAEDLLERMRSNPNALLDYISAGVIGNGSQGAAPAMDCSLAGSDCSAEEIAAYDLWHWEQEIDGNFELRAGQGTGGLASPAVCINGPGFGANGVYSVAVAWRGMNPISSPAISNCGAGSGNYGDADEYRRVLVITTYINAS